ncbi:uncharacterized protein LOC111269974 [Varroa jacobsoni]|uniref:uncharacterized protein LOC111269974 n=1 Tax=Varroa jacobsoni TaxID=62625 RepID=UPI000BF4BEFA|nr:uncharacterized protein LOC111269974 [Varroa jacobsoni]
MLVNLTGIGNHSNDVRCHELYDALITLRTLSTPPFLVCERLAKMPCGHVERLRDSSVRKLYPSVSSPAFALAVRKISSSVVSSTFLVWLALQPYDPFSNSDDVVGLSGHQKQRTFKAKYIFKICFDAT